MIPQYLTARALARSSGVNNSAVVRLLAAQVLSPAALVQYGREVQPLFVDADVQLVRANLQHPKTILKK